MSDVVRGSCLCGGVAYEVTEPFRRANHCHCSRCRKHGGGSSLAQGRVPRSGFALLRGADLLRVYRPVPDAMAKVFCAVCGSSLFGGGWPDGDEVSIRLGSLDSDPGIAPQYHSHAGSAPRWLPVCDDDLPRFSGRPSREMA